VPVPALGEEREEAAAQPGQLLEQRDEVGQVGQPLRPQPARHDVEQRTLHERGDGATGVGADVGVEPELGEDVAERRAVRDVVRVAPVPGVVDDGDLEVARPLTGERALGAALADELPCGAGELEEALALLVRLAVGAGAVVRLAPGVEDVEADAVTTEVDGPPVLLEAGLAPAGGEAGGLDHRVGGREEHRELRDVLVAVGPVPHHGLAGGVAVQPVRVGLVGVAEDVVADEHRDGDAELVAAGEGGPQVVLAAQALVDDDRVAVLEPPVPEDHLADAEVGVGDLLDVLRELVEPERRTGVAQRGPQRADGQRLPDVLGRVVDVPLPGEPAVGVRPHVPVAHVRQQHDVVAVPLVAGLERGVLRPPKVRPVRRPVLQLHEEALRRVAGAPPVGGQTALDVADVEPLHRQVEAAVVDVLLHRDLEERQVVRTHGQLGQRQHPAAGQLEPGRLRGARHDAEHLREHDLRDVDVAVVAHPRPQDDSLRGRRGIDLHVDGQVQALGRQPAVDQPDPTVALLDDRLAERQVEVVRGIPLHGDREAHQAAGVGGVEKGSAPDGDLPDRPRSGVDLDGPGFRRQDDGRHFSEPPVRPLRKNLRPLR
jgi:hypothetical protein